MAGKREAGEVVMCCFVRLLSFLSPVFRRSLSAVMVRSKRLASDEMDILILKAGPAVERYWVIF